jgi:hypothetical protein
MTNQLSLIKTVTQGSFAKASSTLANIVSSLESWNHYKKDLELYSEAAKLSSSIQKLLSSSYLSDNVGLQTHLLSILDSQPADLRLYELEDFKIIRLYELENFRITRERLIALVREKDEDEDHPTSHAFTNAWELIMKVIKILQIDFPKALVAADHEGGIRVRWRSSDKTRDVSLYCPSTNEEQTYIYHEEVGKDYDVDYSVSDLTLSKWLLWLTKNN